LTVTYHTLSTRVAVAAGGFTLVSVALLSLFLIRSQREQVLAEVTHGSEGLAGAIALSIHRDMELNHREGVQQTLETVARESGIAQVRLYNKDGTISFSSDSSEVGRRVSKTAALCASCHSGPVPASALHPDDRSRVHLARDGTRVLSTIHLIRNEQGCQGSGCHDTPTQQSILGVLDVAVPLAQVEDRIGASTRNALLFALAAAALITAVLFFLIRQTVRRPIRRMVAATRKVAAGTEALPVPRGTTPEIGILAKSFNEMLETLSSSNEQLEEWAASLEQQVSAKASELREARFQIVQAEKLSSVGLVAAGIAHELNSPLMAIITFTHLVRNGIPADSPMQEDLRMIEKEANRCAAIIRQLLDYSRKQAESPEVEPVSIASVLEDARELLKVELQNADVRLEVDLEEGLPLVAANKGQILQVFVNLVLNAIHAMPGRGGRIRARAERVHRSDLRGLDLPPHEGPDLVRVSVRDTGSGIQPESLGRVFDPFYTTKPVGQGSGLGLSVSLGLVRSYRGTITVDSDGESWTEFTVYLPAAEQPALIEAR
jgi:two-component system NtrC family sensor kinase